MKLLTFKEAADRLAISIHTVRAWASQGKIEVVRMADAYGSAKKLSRMSSRQARSPQGIDSVKLTILTPRSALVVYSIISKHIDLH